MDEKEYDKFENIINDLHDGTDEVKYVLLRLIQFLKLNLRKEK